MRSTGKWALILGVAMLLAAAPAVGQKTGTGGAQHKTLHKSGTVEAGVEAGCLMVRDLHDHELYNVFFHAGEKPKVGEKISFTATRHDGPTTCMQGIAVDVSAWKPMAAGSAKEK